MYCKAVPSICTHHQFTDPFRNMGIRDDSVTPPSDGESHGSVREIDRDRQTDRQTFGYYSLCWEQCGSIAE